MRGGRGGRGCGRVLEVVGGGRGCGRGAARDERW